MSKSSPDIGQPARGSQTGRPIMVLLDALGRRWSLRILWELRGDSLTFRELQAACDGASPSVLNTRLRELRSLQLIDHDGSGYRLSTQGQSLAEHFLPISRWAEKWAGSLRENKAGKQA